MTIRLPPDLLAEVRQIADKTGRRPGEVVVELCLEALQARRGKPRGEQAAGHRSDPIPARMADMRPILRGPKTSHISIRC
jgi:hypothetical protein